MPVPLLERSKSGVNDQREETVRIAGRVAAVKIDDYVGAFGVTLELPAGVDGVQKTCDVLCQPAPRVCLLPSWGTIAWFD